MPETSTSSVAAGVSPAFLLSLVRERIEVRVK
jgi:hypothetical protein